MKNKISIEWYDEIDSTNTEMQRKIDALENFSVIAAVNQTAGRGQRGNTWHVQEGKNLTFSLFLKFQPGELEAADNFLLSEAAALAMLDYLRGEGVECKIKWPNDIYYKNKKICGMLIENTISERNISNSIIGIGLNVNQKDFPAGLVNPISMSQITNKAYSLKEELVKLCGCLSSRLTLPFGEGMANEYEECLYRKDEFHEYSDCASGKPFEGKIIGVSTDGKLCVETEKGEVRRFAFKEISYII